VAGFQLDFGKDESGLGMKAVCNGGGFYIDIGTSELIIAGAIKLRSSVASRWRNRVECPNVTVIQIIIIYVRVSVNNSLRAR